ncbi:MAG TPA: TonB-dependent receptor, partial [Blastocatellia bacterium]|nr:TonB-dependent receptor [Blastocatellia bacterium]
MRIQVTLINLINRRVINALKNCALGLVCCALAAAIAQAQSISGRITGVITDPAGAIIKNAVVTTTNEGTGAVRRATTDENGIYVVPELPVGSYALKVEGSNFVPATWTRVKVDVGVDTRVNVKLTLQATEAAVNVSAGAPIIQPDSSALSDVVSNQQVEGLPLNGRDFRRLTMLTPGAAPRSQNGSLGSFTVNGQREKANIFLIDGVDNNDSFRNQPSFNQGGVTGAPATLFPIDALGEFNIQTQGAAEYGRNSGAIVNIAVKSGTNRFHGSGYDFLRNDNLDARNFFERCPAANPNCAGGGKNEFRNNNFGGVLGGPIIKNKTFFFTGYEGQREFVFSPGVVRVPSAADIAAARAMNNAGINGGPPRPENPLSTSLLSIFPQPTSGAATGNNYSFAAPNTNDSDNFLVKIDHNFNDRLTLNGRYIFGDGNQTFPLTSGNGSPLPAYQTVVPTRIQLFGVNLTQVLSARLINESRVGYNRYVQTFNPLDANSTLPAGLVTNAQSGGLPTIVIGGFVSLGAPTNVPRGRVSSAYQFVDNLTLTSGVHTYKAGGEYRRAIVNSFNDTNARGALNFNNLADFLAGVPATGTTILRGSTRRDTFTNNYGLFFQDDWKITRRLTLNYGLRYEYLGIFKEEFDRLSNFVPGTGLVPVGGSGLSDLYQPDYNNIAPRLGFAYDVTGKGKTIVRGAYGLYYDTPSQDFFLLQGFASGGPSSPATNPLQGLGVFNAGLVGYGPGVPIFGAAGAPPTSNIGLFAVDLNLRTPYISNYNLNVQHELRPGMALQVSYVGSQGRKLFRVRDINQASPVAIPLGTPTSVATAIRQSRRPFNAQFPQYSFINYLEASANSNYNAVQATLKQRLARGLSFFVTYAYSKSIDDASNGIFGGTRGVSFPQDSFNLAAERAVSVFDQKHRFSGNFTYDMDFLPSALGNLPKRMTEGWQLGGIYTVASGLPITPFFGTTDVSGTGELNDRPNLIGDPNSGALRDASLFFNPAAFAAPAAGTFGTSGRNTIIGPRLNIFDFSLGKATKLNDRFSTQFRAEFFNLFNHANLSLPNANLSSPATFGTISQTPDTTLGNPRLADGG